VNSAAFSPVVRDEVPEGGASYLTSGTTVASWLLTCVSLDLI
jgi:hypothetical protein